MEIDGRCMIVPCIAAVFYHICESCVSWVAKRNRVVIPANPAAVGARWKPKKSLGLALEPGSDSDQGVGKTQVQSYGVMKGKVALGERERIF